MICNEIQNAVLKGETEVGESTKLALLIIIGIQKVMDENGMWLI